MCVEIYTLLVESEKPSLRELAFKLECKGKQGLTNMGIQREHHTKKKGRLEEIWKSWRIDRSVWLEVTY